MVLADTSVWIDHLRRGNKVLVQLLEEGQVLMHPMVRGELSLGSIKGREEFLRLLDHLPTTEMAEYDEIFSYIEREKLFSKGIGWVDVSLIVSAKLSGANLLTLDKKLAGLWRSLV